MNVIQKSNAMGAQSMTSLEIAQVRRLTGAILRSLITRTPRVSFALVTLYRRPSVFTSLRSSMTRLVPSW